MTKAPRILRTEEDFQRAAAELVASWPAPTEDEVAQMNAILSPLAEIRRAAAEAAAQP